METMIRVFIDADPFVNGRVPAKFRDGRSVDLVMTL
jgi:hypothetical protein